MLAKELATKATDIDVMEISSIIAKNIEKSELDRFYLYTQNTSEKAKVFLWCHRFLYSIKNLTKTSNLKNIIDEEVKITEPIYRQICNLIFKIEKQHFGQSRNLSKIHFLLNNPEVDDLIDSFALLTERTSMLSMSRLRGFVLEGNSAKEFKKVFEVPVSQIGAPLEHVEEESQFAEDDSQFEEISIPDDNIEEDKGLYNSENIINNDDGEKRESEESAEE